MAVCYPNVIHIDQVPLELMSILVNECNDWDYRNQKPKYSKVFYKFTSKSYYVSRFSGDDVKKNSSENIKPVLDWISSHFSNHTPLLTSLLAMSPGQRYPAHVDGYVYSKFSKRLHIPIISKPGNNHISFHNDNDTWSLKYHRMEEGHLYELNNVDPHSAENLSDEWRIHLIVDLAEVSLIESKNDWHSVQTSQINYEFMLEKNFLKDNYLKTWTLPYISQKDFKNKI